MVMEYKCGQMEQGMKAIGSTTKPVAKVNFGMWMGMYSKESGKMTKQMVMESIST